MSLQEFKQQFHIPTINVMKGQGRMFADVNIEGKMERLFFSSEVDLKKPLFVSKGVHDAFWVGNNSGSEMIASF